MSRHVVCHDYRGIPTQKVCTSQYTVCNFLDDVTLF